MMNLFFAQIFCMARYMYAQIMYGNSLYPMGGNSNRCATPLFYSVLRKRIDVDEEEITHVHRALSRWFLSTDDVLFRVIAAIIVQRASSQPEYHHDIIEWMRSWSLNGAPW